MKSSYNTLKIVTLFSLLLLSACSGGGGNAGGAETHTISGTVTGLTGTDSLVLQNAGSDNLTLSTNGSFTFATALSSTETYNVTVLSQTLGKSCSVSAETGIASADISNVKVTCTTTSPSLTLNFGLKQLQFSWASVEGATFYKLMQNPDGASGFTQLGSDFNSTTTNTNVDIAVHRLNWPNARYLLSACNASTCVDSAEVFTANEVVKAIGYFKASNTDVGDQFGVSVALSGDGNTLAVGAYFEDSNAIGINGNQADNSSSGAGAVYLYSRSGSSWSQQAYIKASNTDATDRFGFSVALSSDGNTLAVGANRERSNATGINGNQADNSAVEAGAVYLYSRSGSSWSQQAYIKASNTDAADEFGTVVALSGDGTTLAVGVSREASNTTGINNGSQADNSASSAGAVYLYSRMGSSWSQQAYIKASNTDAGDRFGVSVALSSDGNTLAVGAELEDSNAIGINGSQADNSASNAGAVYLYSRTGSSWSQQVYIKASNTDASDYFGSAVGLSGDGNTLAVGAYSEDSNATGINGSQANSLSNAGAVYLYSRTGSSWSQQAYIKASNTDVADRFGSAVVLSSDGNTLAVGAELEDSNATGINGSQADNSASSAGAVYFYSRTGSSWSQQAYIKASNTGAGEQFGISVALSSDGTTLAVGAYFEDSNAIGINGSQADNSAPTAGAVYLY